MNEELEKQVDQLLAPILSISCIMSPSDKQIVQQLIDDTKKMIDEDTDNG